MNAYSNVNEPVLFSISFMIRAIRGSCDIITYMQTGIEKKRIRERERERDRVFYAMQALSVIS
jgi:hypothetical protein